MPVEKLHFTFISNEHIDLLTAQSSISTTLDLSLLLIISRLDKILTIEEFSDLLKVTETEIKKSIQNLIEIGFLYIS